jgi:hypothetical protein
MLNPMKYNPAILTTAAHQIVLQTSDIIHKVKATIKQAQNNKLSPVNKIFDFIKTSASAKGLEALIKNPSD